MLVKIVSIREDLLLGPQFGLGATARLRASLARFFAEFALGVCLITIIIVIIR